MPPLPTEIAAGVVALIGVGKLALASEAYYRRLREREQTVREHQMVERAARMTPIETAEELFLAGKINLEQYGQRVDAALIDKEKKDAEAER